MKKRKEKLKYFDYNLLVVIIFLTCFGLVMLYSTSAYIAQVEKNDSFFYFNKQAAISAGSFILMLLISRCDYHLWEKLAVFGYIVGTLALFLVRTPIGISAKGASRWIKIPVINQQLQPAEITKIAIIIFLPFLICKMGRKVRTLRGYGTVFLAGALVFFLIFKVTENLSTAIIVLGITVILIFVVHPKTWPFLVGGVAVTGLGAAFLAYIVANIDSGGDFRIERILVWLRPEEYAADGTGYQVLQGLYAIGSGGFFGKGLGNSTQKLGAIPEVQNDMIFSIICEELGVFGAIIVMTLFGIMLYRLLFIARNAKDLFGSLIVTGIFAHISLQVILNIAVAVNLIPTTGITLPFISYGGTSIVFLMIEMGLALSVARQITFE